MHPAPIFVAAFLLATASSIKLLSKQPEWLKAPCKRKDPNLNECIRSTFQGMFPYFAKGIPEVNIPRFEPLFIEKIGITKGHGAVTLTGNFNNLYAHGPSNTTAVSCLFDIENGRFNMGLNIPMITTESQYNLKGNILLLPLIGVGNAKLILRNVTTEVYMKVSFPKVQGEEVMRVDGMKVEFRMANCRVHLDNLFNGNKVLGHTVNNFLNKNALEVVEELKENIGENLAVVFKKIMNDAFTRIPTRFWIPKDD
ncbi:protein takeout [Halyomorpha halys]|uniref:protein takeout n=1 Tax=Halyomorpha halys TaxID=286706 RepID=UPI0006D51766|nr:protein takeout [Halyomorpha halys]